MNMHFKHLAIVAALCGSVSVAQVCAASATKWVDCPSASEMASIYPPGPEADLYLQHYQGTPSFRYAEQSWGELSLNWSELVLNGRAPTRTSIYPPGPEADPYLEHYQGTVSYRYRLPVALTASTWQLTDYAVVDRDGCATHPLGKHSIVQSVWEMVK